jgi:hypothetical protein
MFFHIDHTENRSILGTLDSSCSNISIRNTILISLGIQLTLDLYSIENRNSSKRGS